jgi:hypothetical protein
VVCILFPLHHLVPELRPYLEEEGAIVENVSATLCFLTAVLGFWICWTARERAGHRVYLAIPVFGALFLLDEISFGHIFLGYTPPTLYGFEIESIHEIANPAFGLWTEAGPIVQVGCLVAAALALVVFRSPVRRLLRAALELLRVRAPYRFVLICGALGATAIALDLDTEETFLFAEELLELNAALALFFAAATIPERAPRAPVLAFHPVISAPAFRVLAASSIAAAALAGALYGVGP